MRELTEGEMVLVSGGQDGGGGSPGKKEPPTDGGGGVDPFFEPIGDAMDNPFSTIGEWMDSVVQDAYQQGLEDGDGKGGEAPDTPADFYNVPDGGEIQPYH